MVLFVFFVAFLAVNLMKMFFCLELSCLFAFFYQSQCKEVFLTPQVKCGFHSMLNRVDGISHSYFKVCADSEVKALIEGKTE